MWEDSKYGDTLPRAGDQAWAGGEKQMERQCSPLSASWLRGSVTGHLALVTALSCGDGPQAHVHIRTKPETSDADGVRDISAFSEPAFPNGTPHMYIFRIYNTPHSPASFRGLCTPKIKLRVGVSEWVNTATAGRFYCVAESHFKYLVSPHFLPFFSLIHVLVRRLEMPASGQTSLAAEANYFTAYR